MRKDHNHGDQPLPQANRSVETAAGHWVLARAGKRVLRPGGLRLTQAMLAEAHLRDQDVVEFAPGLGRTASLIVGGSVRSYTGVEQDPAASARVSSIVAAHDGTVMNARAQETGLGSACADVVIGEAMLTMQGAKTKDTIVTEARRLLRPGGRYAIHELALTPDDIDQGEADALRKTLAQTIRVNARPLTVAEWREVLERAGFVVDWVQTAPMTLLSPRRNLADEGILGVLRIMKNVLRDKDLRKRIMRMRKPLPPTAITSPVSR